MSVEMRALVDCTDHASCSDLAKRDFDSFTFEKIDPELNVLLPFSSGTTGVPKVTLAFSSHRGLFSWQLTSVALPGRESR